MDKERLTTLTLYQRFPKEFPYNTKVYTDGKHFSDEFRLDVLAKLLSSYDEATWNKLRSDRKRTYRRAASTVLYDYNKIANFLNETGGAV